MTDIVFKDNSKYPNLLKQIKSAPKQLYYRGEWDKDIFKNCLAVVGSRRLTSYGKRAIEQIIGEVALSGVTIVSGFMYGGDAIAHQATLKAGGRTIAVMPCGIERIHPEYQKSLYQEILDNNGLIISEYAGDMQPTLWSYPQRNRIVAGLSKAILIAEAGLKSGSLITANYSKKFKRKVFAFPGPINSSVSKGTNLLIKEGAEMVLESGDILDYYSSSRRSPVQRDEGGFVHKAKPASAKGYGVASKILQALDREPLTADELGRSLNISASELGIKLSLMQIQGLIKEERGKYYGKE